MLAVVGIAVVGLTLLDLTWSTLSAEGAGPLSRRTARGLWRSLTRGAPPDGLRRRVAGAATLLGVAALWVGLLLGGWGLTFGALPGHVVAASDGSAADLGDRLYFAGYAVTTLGNGEFRPSTSMAQALTVAAALSGLFLITLTVTYLIPVVSAVTEARRLASSIHALGRSGEEIVRCGWDGRGFAALERALERTADALSLHAERHLTYPVVHYFEGGARRTAFAPNAAALADALLLLRHGVGEKVRPADAAIQTLDGALRSFTDALEGTPVTDGRTPPVPSGSSLAGTVPLAAGADASVAKAAEAAADGRARLHAYVQASGYAWPAPPAAAPPERGDR